MEPDAFLNVEDLLGSKMVWLLPWDWTEEESSVDQTHRSLEPVSKSRLRVWPGVPAGCIRRCLGVKTQSIRSAA